MFQSAILKKGLIVAFAASISLNIIFLGVSAKQINGTALMASWNPQPASFQSQASFDDTETLTESNKITVPMGSDSRSLAVNAILDNQQPARFILDTGATYTTISRTYAEALGYDLQSAPRVNITTASGQVSIPKIKLRSITLNGYTVHDVDATVMNLPSNVPFDGLLGLSFVKRQKITINTARQHLVIEPNSTYTAVR